MTSGGIGANHELVAGFWPASLGKPPSRMLSGVPDHVDGRMLKITEDAGASIINPDRMWHYTEGIENWNPIWTRHGIRILPRPLAAVARRARQAPAGAAVPGLRHARDARAPDENRLRPQLVRAHPEDHRARVRALGLRAEPGSDLAQRAPGAGGPRRQGRTGARRAVQAPRRRLHRRARPARPRPADERADRRRADRRRRPYARDPGARPRDRQSLHQGPPDHRDPRGPEIPSRSGDPRRAAPPDPRPGRGPADRRPAVDPHAQDARRVSRQTSRAACSRPAASRCRGCTPPARSPGSAVAESTATARSRERSSAAACSAEGSRGEPRRRPSVSRRASGS